MYLYVWLDGSFASVSDNIATGDILGVQQKTLNIFRKNTESWEFAVVDNGKLYWVPVQEARIVATETFRFHLK